MINMKGNEAEIARSYFKDDLYFCFNRSNIYVYERQGVRKAFLDRLLC